MTTITQERAAANGERIAPGRRRIRSFRVRPLHASAIVSAVVALKAFEMSFAALHNLAVHNLVEPRLAANVPLAIDGLMVGSIVATASFRKGSLGWWYATALFALSTLVSVAGNIEYAREIGGGIVALAIYAGMPLTMLFAVHLTLLLWAHGREAKTEMVAPNTVPETPVLDLNTDQRLAAAWAEIDPGARPEIEHPAPAGPPAAPMPVSPLLAAAHQATLRQQAFAPVGAGASSAN
ncbi:DUF2637 domain-containing protein [Nocardia sp. NPDC048505]|uniref:DUF2637 domain-containing protein n=1 Tax=unclassified Nocardia TaxID=2637762 RepID=UPI0033EAA2C7